MERRGQERLQKRPRRKHRGSAIRDHPKPADRTKHEDTNRARGPSTHGADHTSDPSGQVRSAVAYAWLGPRCSYAWIRPRRRLLELAPSSSPTPSRSVARPATVCLRTRLVRSPRRRACPSVVEAVASRCGHGVSPGPRGRDGRMLRSPCSSRRGLRGCRTSAGPGLWSRRQRHRRSV